MGIVTYCQLAFIDIAGFSREALLGSADTIAGHPERRPLPLSPKSAWRRGLLHAAEELRLLLRHLESSVTSLVWTQVD